MDKYTPYSKGNSSLSSIGSFTPMMNSSKAEQPKKETKYRETKINIDSRHRNVESKNILDNEIFYLDENALDIVSTTIDDNDVIVNFANHGFEINDNITLQGVTSPYSTMDSAITFFKESSYARINHKNHGLDFNSINDITVVISGFTGNINSGTNYNNIPINQINGLQILYAVKDTLEIKNNDYYYIKMDSIIANFAGTYDLTQISIIPRSINGVNINLLNANYPLGISQLQGFHTITATDTNSFSFKLGTNNNITQYKVGGPHMQLSKIVEFNSGYIKNNFYKIPLKRTFYNVKKIRMLSSEFPNTEKVIKSIPEAKKNNSFYWKLLSDGDTEYSIELTPGNYSVALLTSTLKAKIEAVKRNVLTVINKNISTTNYSYYEYNKCSVSLEPETDYFSVVFYTTIFVPKALTFQESTSFADGVGRLLINHPNHYLIVGSIITIINATYTNSIPQDVINNSFEIEAVIDDNNYRIKLPKYNISATNTSVTNGGDEMGIVFPVKAQLLFDKSDTFGSLIGYRNVGEPNSITSFNFVNNNTQLYLYDRVDSNEYINNSINLSGDNYILMTSPLTNRALNSGLASNVFCKLLLAGNPGSVLFNQYIQMCDDVDLPVVTDWEVSFYDASDSLYDFGNLEHSYTLEIIEEIES
jgi:hypothetical protein